MNGEPLVRFEGVSKRFGDQVAVDDVTLSIREGEFFALLGPSGCGKTTLMRMLAGLETPSAGRILLSGKDLSDLPPHKRPVNMMFQSYALFPHMSVADNIAFGLKMENLPKGEIAARVAEMLALVKLEPYAKRMPHQLSGGQKQRVALARSLAKRPKVLLLDEPLAALDKKLREETQFELKALQAKLGAAFLIVTHDQDEAMVLADRMAIMDQGRIVQVGAPSDIYERPIDRRVAGFIGDINLFEAKAVAVEGERLRIAALWAKGELSVPSEDQPVPGEPVWLAVRPEKLSIGRQPSGDPALISLPGRVAEVGYLGDWSTYLVETGGRVVRVAQANAGARAPEPLARGDQVFVGFDPDVGVLLTA